MMIEGRSSQLAWNVEAFVAHTKTAIREEFTKKMKLIFPCYTKLVISVQLWAPNGKVSFVNCRFNLLCEIPFYGQLNKPEINRKTMYSYFTLFFNLLLSPISP